MLKVKFHLAFYYIKKNHILLELQKESKTFWIDINSHWLRFGVNVAHSVQFVMQFQINHSFG